MDKKAKIKNIILINGTMGVGKTTTCLELQKILTNNVFLDGDWCWNMKPFIINDETKNMVNQNITYLLNNFIKCSEYDNVIFCWVMHEQDIIDEIISKLNLTNCKLHIFSLVCSENILVTRLKKDIDKGIRTSDVIERTIPRLKNYYNINSTKIDVSSITAYEAAKKIKTIIEA